MAGRELRLARGEGDSDFYLRNERTGKRLFNLHEKETVIVSNLKDAVTVTITFVARDVE